MDNLNWSLILRALSHRMEQLKALIKIYNHNPDQHMHDLEVAEHELEICRKEYKQVLIAQQQSNKLTSEERVRYTDLQNYYSSLTKEILGDDCHNVVYNVFDDLEKEAYHDLIDKIKHLKLEAVAYKQLFYFLAVLNLLALIWSVL